MEMRVIDLRMESIWWRTRMDLAASMLGACCVYTNRSDFCQRIPASSSPPIPCYGFFSATITGNFFVQ